MPATRTLRIALAGLVLLGGLVHLQQFLDGFRSIPIIGPMFLANAAASVFIAGMLVLRREPLWVAFAALIAAGSLGAILISRGPGLFDYISTTFEAPEVLAVVSEALALAVAGLILVKRTGAVQPQS